MGSLVKLDEVMGAVVDGAADRNEVGESVNIKVLPEIGVVLQVTSLDDVMDTDISLTFFKGAVVTVEPQHPLTVGFVPPAFAHSSTEPVSLLANLETTLPSTYSAPMTPTKAKKS